MADLADLAKVPEHSLPLMTAISGGSPLIIDDYLFLHADDWLMAIGYPLSGLPHAARFAAVLAKARQRVKPARCFAIAPQMPAELTSHVVERDRYYLLSAQAPIPARLRNPVARANSMLTIHAGREFTPAHRRLWAEFMERNGHVMNSRVAELYAAAPSALRKAASLYFLDAWDANGNLAACLLLDDAAANFTSYILGAHSRAHYTPHAADALFAAMLRDASARGKRYMHLGLGVNPGILRFKQKWGALPGRPFVMAQWEEAAEESAAHMLARSILYAPAGASARQILQNEPSQRPFAMLWRVEKAGRVSWLGGTAHFFLHSFEDSLRYLFRQVETVIFEGPLDARFMAAVDEAGKQLPPGIVPLAAQLTEAEIAALDAVVNGPRGPLAQALGLTRKDRFVDVRALLERSRTWHAFFSLWSGFLERLGWRQSVDLEAWRLAHALDKKVIGMESLDEQLESLCSLPDERALRFFRACSEWKRRARHNLRAYLAGDLEGMMGSSAEFPTRTEHIVGRRDQRFRERMRPWLEQGRTAVFVGSAHLVNLRHMLAEDGFDVRQQPLGIWPKLHLQWRKWRRPDGEVTWQVRRP